MKLLVGLLAVSMAICATIALPARSPNDEVELVDVPPKTRSSANSDTDAAVDADVEPDFRDFKGVVDTGVGYPFLQPLPHPFSFNLGFFDSFDDILRRLRTRLFPVEFGSDSESSEDGLAVNLDPSKGANTTSVVKVVDGHKIEINDTVYSNGDQSNGAVFKFRVINIRPIDSSEESTPDDARQNPVTSSPGSPNNNSVEGDDTSNERKESKESTEKDENNKTIDNEITKNIDDQEVKSF